MKLSEIKGEDALDVLAEILEPATEIMTDPKTKTLVDPAERMSAVKFLIKDHKKAIIHILAVLDGKDPDNYDVNLLTLPVKLLELLNDEDLVSFFES